MQSLSENLNGKTKSRKELIELLAEVQIELSHIQRSIPAAMEDKLRWNFNVFLLEISKELAEGDLQQMKFVLKGYVTSAKCDEMNALQYVEELQKLLLLTPTKLEIFKETLKVIGRPDLVEKIENKEAAFATLHGENLEQKGW